MLDRCRGGIWQTVEMKLHLPKGFVWLGLAAPLLLHLPAIAQTDPARDEVGQIGMALRIIMSDYVTPVAESTLVTACLNGMRQTSVALSLGAESQEVKPRLDIKGLPDGLRPILNFLERAPNADSVRQLGDACLHRVFLELDPRSAYFDRNEVEKLRRPSRAVAPKGSDASPAEVNPRRDVQSAQSVTSKVIEGKHLYLHVSRLDDKTLEQLGGALRTTDPVAFREVSGMVLDLRENQGGLLTAMVGVAAVFLPASARVATAMGRDKELNISYLADSNFYYRGVASTDPLRELPLAVKNLPLLVLINRHTASGAEAIAAALQDNQRAKVIGEQTLGYGTVQTVRMLSSDTAIKLTTSKLIRPNGEEWEMKGVTPDYYTVQKVRAGIELGSRDDAELAEALLKFDK
jgi:carboxyl-terminal processing protease